MIVHKCVHRATNISYSKIIFPCSDSRRENGRNSRHIHCAARRTVQDHKNNGNQPWKLDERRRSSRNRSRSRHFEFGHIPKRSGNDFAKSISRLKSLNDHF